MEEGSVTIDDETLALPSPFMVVATQNPIEMEGVFELPEAQRDRFSSNTSSTSPTVMTNVNSSIGSTVIQHLPLRSSNQSWIQRRLLRHKSSCRRACG